MAAHLVRPDWAALEEYKPVKPLDVLAEEIGVRAEQLIKLDANENLYGPVPEIRAAIAQADHHIYPDPGQLKLRAALAAFTRCEVEQVVAGQGSDDLLDLVLRLVDPHVVVTAPPTFGMYSFLGKIAKARIHDVPRLPAPSFDLDVPALVAAIRAHKAQGERAVLFIASPNNPTGNLVPEQELRLILAEGVLTVLDEAYIEFASVPSAARLLPAFPNLVVCRTFSKWAALAGVRVGYSLAHRDLSSRLMAIKQPYNLNTAADAAAQAALRHLAKVQHTVDLLKAEKLRLSQVLAQVPWLQPLPSESNFVLVLVLPTAPLPAEQLVLALRKRAILIRFFTAPALRSYIRVSAGRPADTDALLAGLRAIEAEAKGTAAGGQ